jgi:glyoxylase-like metal-dependent hydrolase (beta-lactamase superfamily II)
MKIADNVFVVPGVTANTYLLAGPEGLTLIDTGLPYSQRTILKYVASKGWSARDIKRILITHADLDHYGCLAALRRASGACTYASPLEASAMARGASSRPIKYTADTLLQRLAMALFNRILRATPVQVDEILAEGQILPVLDGLHVVETPGHSPNHLSFFAPVSGILFCGDSMRSDGKKGLRGSHSRNDWDHAVASASVRKQAALGAGMICPGHGPVIRDAREAFSIIVA